MKFLASDKKTAVAGASFVLALLFASALGFAADYSAAVTLSKSALSICPGDTQQIVAVLANTGAKDDVYALSANTGWATIAPSQVAVKSGQSATFYVYITPEYNAKPGPYNVEISAKSSSTSAKTTVALDLQNCSGVSVAPKVAAREACVDESASYEIDVKNTGKWTDRFALSASSGSLSSTEVTLLPGETRTLRLDVAAPSVAGDQNLTVTATSKSPGGASASTNLALKAIQCYNVDVSADKTKTNFCPNRQAVFTFTVKNSGTRDDVYSITTSAGGLSGRELKISSGQSATVSLSLDASAAASVTVKSPKVERVVSVEATKLTAEECWGFNATADKKYIELNEPKGQLSTITLKNTGIETARYSIDYTGPAWSYVDPKSLELSAGAEAPFFVYLAPTPNTTSDVYRTTVTITSDKNVAARQQKVVLVYGNVSNSTRAAAKSEAEGAAPLIPPEIEKKVAEEVAKTQNQTDVTQTQPRSFMDNLRERLGPGGTLVLILVVIAVLLFFVSKILLGKRSKFQFQLPKFKMPKIKIRIKGGEKESNKDD